MHVLHSKELENNEYEPIPQISQESPDTHSPVMHYQKFTKRVFFKCET